MAEKEVTIKIIGDAKSATSAFKDVEGAAGKTETALGRIGSTAAGVAIGGALTQLPGILMDGAKGAAEDEAAMLRLRTAVENTGTSYDSMSPAVEDAIANGQKLAFTDGETADALAMLTSLTGDSDEAMRRLSSAQDLARGAGISLEQAAKLLGKTSDENTTALGRLGIQVGENATAQDVLNAVDQKFQGQAGTYAASSAGQMQIAQQNAGELAETFGSMLMPVISLLTGAMLSLSTMLQTTVAPAIQGMIASLQPVIDVIVNFVTNHLEAFKVGLAAIGIVILASFVPAMVAATVAALPVIAALVAVGAAAALLYTAWSTNFLGIQDITASVIAFLQENILPVLQAVFDGIIAGVNFVRENWDTVWNGLSAVVGVVVELVSGYITSLGGVIETISAFVTGMIDIVKNLLEGDFAGAWDAAKTMVSGVIDGIGTIVSGLPETLFGYFTDAATKVLEVLSGLALDAATKAGEVVSGFIGAFVSFVSDVGQFFIDAASGAIGTLITFVSDVTTKAGEVVSGFIGAFVSFVSDVGQFFIDAASGAIGTLITFVSDVTTKAGEVVSGFIGAFASFVTDVVQFYINMATEVLNTLTGFVTDVGTKAGEVVSSFLDAFVSFVSDVVQFYIDVASEVLNTLSGFVTDVGSKAGEVVSAFLDAFVSFVSDAVQFYIDLASDVLGELSDLVSDVTEKGREVVQGFIDGAKGLISTAVSTITGIKDDITGGFSGAASWLFSAGADIVQGLIDGINSLLGSVRSKISELGGLLKIDVPGFSPPYSAGFKQGRSFVDGLTEGVASGAGRYASVMGSIADGMDLGVGGSSGGGAAPSTPPSGGSGGAASGSSQGWLAMKQGATFLSCGADGFGLFQWPDGKKQWLEASFCRGGQTGPSAYQLSHAAGVSASKGLVPFTAPQSAPIKVEMSDEQIDRLAEKLAFGAQAGTAAGFSGVLAYPIPVGR